MSLSQTINFEGGFLYFNYYVVENDKLIEKNISHDEIKDMECVVSAKTLNEFLISEDFFEIGEIPLKVGEKIKILDYTITNSVVMLKIRNEKGNVYCIGHVIGAQI